MKTILNKNNMFWQVSLAGLAILAACDSRWGSLVGKPNPSYRNDYPPHVSPTDLPSSCATDAKGIPVLGKPELQAAEPSNVTGDDCGDPRESFKWVDMLPSDGKTLRVGFDLLRQKQMGYASIEKLTFRDANTRGTLTFKCKPSAYGLVGVVDCTVQCLTPSDVSKVCLPQKYTNYVFADDNEGRYVLSEITITSVPVSADANSCKTPASGTVKVDFTSADGGDAECDNISRARSVSGLKFPSLDSVSVPNNN